MTAKQAEWRDRVARWRESGLTAGEFANGEGVRVGTLRHWAWQLRRGRSEGASGATRAAFVEVLAPVARRDLEIVVGERLRIVVPVDFDGETLRRALEILEAR